MRRYCLGFLTNEIKTEVALIRKENPEWQRGKWNGIGGKVGVGQPGEDIDPNESAVIAMPREFEEETGVCTIVPKFTNSPEITFPKWTHLFHIESEQASQFGDYELDVFTLASDWAIERVRTVTNEKVGVFNIWDIDRLPTTPNVVWFSQFIRHSSSTFQLPIHIKDVGGF
jgi:8-oxo-dGTP diphosphatase